MWTLAVFGLALVCVVLDIVRRYLVRTIPRSSYPLPPGPRGLPLVGNIVGLNDAPWLTYAEWAKKYGDLMYIRALGRDMIIINSEVVAEELLENRSKNYSDRPYLSTKRLQVLSRRCVEGSLALYSWNTGTDGVYTGDSFIIHFEARQCIDKFSEHIFEYTASVILNSVYDYDVKTGKDELLDVVARTLKILGRALRTENTILVGALPAVLKLPSWFPGMSFKQEMAIAKASSKQYVEMSFQYSLQRLSAGSPAVCMVFDAFQDVEEKGTSTGAGWMQDLSHAAATGFIAGSETSNSVISTFFLMMTLNPEAQKKAQAQIDTVVGGKGLPTIEDRPMLPYVDAILREILRYAPVVPLSIPHAAVDDDVFAGFRIPKGAIVIPNLWSMAHNEFKYPNSHAFIPERFLRDDGTLKSDGIEHIAYGFGRRMCVGRHFADTSVWLAIVNILAVFTIEKARDDHGVEIPVEAKFAGGVATRPVPFRCSVVPRIPGLDAEQLEQLIEASTV